jgi:hypothetical protein
MAERRPKFGYRATISILFTLTTWASFGRTPLTPEAAVETVRFVEGSYFDSAEKALGPFSVSPDGERFVVRTARGDLKNNNVEIAVLAGGLRTLHSAVNLRRVVVLHSSGLGSPNGGFHGPWENSSGQQNPVRWLNNQKIAFIASDVQGVNQVVTLDLASGVLVFLTHHPTQVGSFEIGPGGTVLYSAESSHTSSESRALSQHGFTVRANTDAGAIINGDFDGYSFVDSVYNMEWYVQRRGSSGPERLRLAAYDHDTMFSSLLKIAPDGRHALVSASGTVFPSRWMAYVGPFRPHIQEAIRDPALLMARLIGRLFVVDLQDLSARPLWDAPFDLALQRASWSPDSRHVLLSSAFLPPGDKSAGGNAGNAVVVLDTTSGAYEALPIVMTAAATALAWISPTRLAIVAPDSSRELAKRVFSHSNGSWREVSGLPPEQTGLPRITLGLIQSLNDPPKLVAREVRSGRELVVLDPNPDLLRKYELAKVRHISGTLSGGGGWEGWLYYPTRYVPGTRYPLVIQSDRGSVPQNTFSLYGNRGVGLGPAVIGPEAAQLLAAHQMFVVQLIPRSGGVERYLQSEGELFRSAYEELVSDLSAGGLIRTDKVGLLGFSREGFHVDYALTHSKLPIAAAITADNWDAGYFTTAISGWDVDAFKANGAAPFGAGLETWLKSAPGFNVDKVRAPLLIEVQSSGRIGLLLGWEMFSRLRFLRRPVDMWAIPDFEHGTHNMQNPAQLVAVQHKAIDWFDFWLNGKADSNIDDEAQYSDWMKLREMQDDGLASAGSEKDP